MSDGVAGRTVLVDASVFITLAAVDATDLLDGMSGTLVVPERVVEELTDEQSRRALADARDRGAVEVGRATARLEDARTHLGSRGADSGDVGVLALALDCDDPVAVTDDKPLRETCKALSIPISGSLGVLIRAVERDEMEAATAKAKLEAFDEVGARVSASLYRRAERPIDDAAEE